MNLIPTTGRRTFIQQALSLGGLFFTVIKGASPLSSRPKPPSKLAQMLASLQSPVLMSGDETTAYRDPTAIYHKGWFYLYFTLVQKEGAIPYSYVAWSKSKTLSDWTPPKVITAKSSLLDFGSPGDIVRIGEEWVLCIQTYPRPHGERYGNADARIWTIRSRDLETWNAPELLRVQGNTVSEQKMGRMIDPYIIQDKDHSGIWWCLYKQDGIRLSRSSDFRSWVPVGKVSGGENPCIIVDRDEYVLFYSPANGIGVKRSQNLRDWIGDGVITLGQSEWPWAAGRITAGFVTDLRRVPGVGRALMFFHGSRYSEEDSRGGFDNFASLGIAWSSDLREWHWPGQSGDTA